jgi:hypothetical protein
VAVAVTVGVGVAHSGVELSTSSYLSPTIHRSWIVLSTGTANALVT